MNAPAPRKPLGELLLGQGIITSDQLTIALSEQKRTSIPLGKLLVQLGFVTEETITDALSENLGREAASLANMLPDHAALKLIPKDTAKRYKLLPLGFDQEGQTLVVGMADPNNIVALDQLRALLKGRFALSPRLVGEGELQRAIDQFYGYEFSIDGILREIETGEIDYASLQSSDAEYSQPVVRLIDAILADAVQKGVSDIHIEPEQRFLRIRYRIDGVLRQIRSLHISYWPAMLVRLKVLSGMNIAESRAPQDGRISMMVSGRPVDFRAAVQPVTWGENFVARILDRQRSIVPLDGLGLADENLDLLKLMLARPEGILLVTGPTGSGKTTTLYSILSHLNSERVHIMTLEDPVEYPLPLVRQASVNESAKMDFANGIRSMMRQDPDIILVGEIRDADTAEMAFRAAMTGHQVFSTLHTNSAIGAIPRLLDIGVLPDIMAGNIIGVVAQRLVRRLCLHCRQAYQADEIEARLLGITGYPTLYRAVGCQRCDNHGYRGRMTIMELLKMDGDLDDLIARRATTQELRRTALAKGFKPLVDDGSRRVLDGSTSLEEVSRVVDLTSRL
ncbi:MAG TPA: ATPase, T2SS/T4P/T4SS family [Rhodocyclaceae bacterium]|nr:ATPase, T2SS/T4P/T4SS family [Rhodocyclaceae bacterium]